MNILVISDQFKKGGLETHIDTFWRMLREEHEMWFCFADYDGDGINFQNWVNSTLRCVQLYWNENPFVGHQVCPAVI